MVDTLKSYIYKTDVFEEHVRKCIIFSFLSFSCLNIFLVIWNTHLFNHMHNIGLDIPIINAIFIFILGSLGGVAIMESCYIFMLFFIWPLNITKKITEDDISNIDFVTETFPVSNFSMVETQYKAEQNIDISSIKVRLNSKSFKSYLCAEVIADMAYLNRNGNKVSLRFRPVIIKGKRFLVNPELVDVIEA